MLDYSIIIQPADNWCWCMEHLILFSIELKKIKDRILKILVTALLESIDLLIAVFDAHDN